MRLGLTSKKTIKNLLVNLQTLKYTVKMIRQILNEHYSKPKDIKTCEIAIIRVAFIEVSY